jgi:phage-related protein
VSGWEIHYYETVHGRCPVAEYLDALDERDAVAVTQVIDLLEAFGVGLGPPHAKHLQGKLWELRAKGRVQHRVLYFATAGRRLILLHAFVKKTQQTPRRELDTAVARLHDIEQREGR